MIGLSLVSMCIQVAHAKVDHFFQDFLLSVSQIREEIEDEATGYLTGIGIHF